MKSLARGAMFGAAAVVCAAPALAQQEPAATPAAPAAPAASPAPWPAMAGVLAANPAPMSFDLGLLGKGVTIGGVGSGFYQVQNHPATGDSESQIDIDNAQLFVNKSSGLIQYFVQIGAYSLPDIGVPYVKAATATRANFGVLSQWFVKIAPSSKFSIEAGALPTLVGAEDTFSFENLNIERGLLWNQENAVNRGVQANLTVGPVVFALSWNDGFYSNRYSWIWGSATWTINSANTLAVVAGGNTRHTRVSTFVTPIFQNNEEIYNLVFTHTHGPWIVEPYFQYAYVPALPELGATHSASTYGAALLVSYAFPAKSRLAGVSLPMRVEYITSTGAADEGAPNLIYGPGSKAWSITVTPTYQFKRYFVRAEFSYVDASDVTPGFAFGPTGAATSQTRGVIETGVLF